MEQYNDDMYHGVVRSMVATLEAKDFYTYGHSTRVADMAYKLGKVFGNDNGRTRINTYSRRSA